MSDTLFNIDGSSLTLKRFPDYGERNLRAWDAADEYILNRFRKDLHSRGSLRILILNDQFGALTLPLCTEHSVTGVSDSAQFLEGLKINAERNNIFLEQSDFHPSHLNNLKPENFSSDQLFDLILIKIPKQVSFFEYQLKLCEPLVRPGGEIWAAGMIKYISPRIRELMKRTFGNSDSSLAVKKARIISCIKEENTSNSGDISLSRSIEVPPPLDSIETQPGVFSRERLDPGTRFFLENLPELDDNQRILDFGCGSGILSLAAASSNLTVSVTALDNSMAAVECTKKNARRKGLNERIECVWGWSLKQIQGEYDSIWSNPPFHDNTSVSQKASEQMIKESYGLLKPGGTLQLVINRHLGYQRLIQETYGNCTVRKSNKKYILLQARKKN